MIKGRTPQHLTTDQLKDKARHSASVLSSLVLSGYRGLKYAIDVDLVLYYVGIHLLARSIHKDICDARKLNVGFSPDAFLTVTKLEIGNEIKYIEQNLKS